MQNVGMRITADKAMAARLRQARELARYKSASDAARAMRIPEQTYLAHENATNGFKRSADRYASFFKVDLWWLVTGAGKPKGVTIEAEILELAPDEQRQIQDMVEFFKARKAR